jgi:hypothetical protein
VEEDEMALSNAIRDMVGHISERIAMRRRLAGFACADCDRVHRCNLTPNDTSIARAEQIVRGDWLLRRRAKALLREARLF